MIPVTPLSQCCGRCRAHEVEYQFREGGRVSELTILSPFLRAAPGWWRKGACRESDMEKFFAEPVSPGSASDDEWRAATLEAKAVCLGCAVRPQCLAWSVQVEVEL